DKLARTGVAPALTPTAPSHWSVISVSDRFAWHDHRLGPVPGRRYGTGVVASWAIPVVVDGRQDRITGKLWHAQGPALWQWLVLFGLAPLVAVFVGVGDAGVLVHGYVISGLPAAVIRAAAATAVCAGLIAAVSVAVGHLAESSKPSARSGRAAMSVPRGKVRSR